ncbi:MAG: CaiB/BaiF CoA-transferase family protein [Actinomycetota bacterium]|jgi:alpha-methylacyl-CoA racemase|nr:CaiB/BaiF CoA-transferase family protein [Actinomycetota bacterium]MDA3015145.1 CaiB/BaiF CoA-transferase family protein [Actinomycetota bacterium]MDA3027417.1 CaiB/BaiF CoA-transferase family protein [Actinomycetota bacterium]
MSGPLTGYRIIEIAGIGPGPFAAMMLADMGAEVIRVDRAQAVRGAPDQPVRDVLQRNRRNIALDLKHPDGVAVLLDLVAEADALIEGFRPGVMERLGVGPDVCLERNPRLVFGRMTGWGQTGPYAQAAGHDINYIALGGALAHIGRSHTGPVPPLNLVGDFGGGGMFLAYGVVCALLEAQRSGAGQVVDAAMVDGTATLMGMFWGLSASGIHDPTKRGTSMLDSGAHFYDAYECSDGEWISLGSIEPQFYAELLEKLDLTDDERFTRQMDRSLWPELKDRLRAIFATRTRDEWCELMEHTDICFAPVLTMAEAAEHPHNVERGTFCEVAGLTQPSPAPRFSRTVPEKPGPAAHPGEHTRDVLRAWGIDDARVDAVIASGGARQA